jgi:DNA-directed RNA polymerase specialized sigma24 family protein
MQETADILRISQPSVSGRLSRARKRLKAFLEGEGYDER